MNHLRPMTKQQSVAKADAVQDAICAVVNFVGSLFDSFGASSPLLNWVLDKCDPTT